MQFAAQNWHHGRKRPEHREAKTERTRPQRQL
jgi:hypothetical protein